MATNSTAYFGFQPSRRLDGAALNFMVNYGYIAYNNAHTFGTGDVVTLLSTGYVDTATTSTNPVLGVFANCAFPPTGQAFQAPTTRIWNAPTLSSTTVVTTQYWDDPQVVFRVRTNGTLTQSAIGLNATFGSNGSPNTTTGLSTAFLDTTTVSTLSTLPFRIIGFSNEINNVTTAANAVMEVILNTSVYKTGTGV